MSIKPFWDMEQYTVPETLNALVTKRHFRKPYTIPRILLFLRTYISTMHKLTKNMFLSGGSCVDKQQQKTSLIRDNKKKIMKLTLIQPHDYTTTLNYVYKLVTNKM